MESLNSIFSSTFKPPRSRISDFLPSNIIDEIEVNPPKTSISNSNLSFKDAVDSRSTQFSSNSTLSGSYLLYNSSTIRNPERKNTQTYINSNKLPLRPRMIKSSQSVLSNVPNNYVYNSNINYVNMQNFTFNNNYGCYANNNIVNNQNESIETITEQQVETYITNIQYQLGVNQGNRIFFHIPRVLDFIGNIVFIQMIKTNQGSRFFQKNFFFSPLSQSDLECLLQIIVTHIEDVLCDFYANYFLQKLLPYCTLQNRLLLYKYIKPIFISIASDKCGNHSLQSLIILQNSLEEEKIIKDCIEDNIKQLSFGANSSHVIQKTIKAIKESNRDYINSFVIANLISLSLDSHGIYIVKEFIDKTENICYLKAVVSIFELEITKLTYDQYGNFGIQEAIKIYGIKHCRGIISKITDHLVDYSLFKFSSNVVDFIIDFLFKYDYESYIQTIANVFSTESLGIMLKNKYATYVIENCMKALNEMKSEEMRLIKLNILTVLIEFPNIKDKKKIYKYMKKLNQLNKQYVN